MTSNSIAPETNDRRDFFALFMSTKVAPQWVKRLIYQPRLKILSQEFGDGRPFKVLDIGAGNHSASRTKHFFPQCEYYGIDISREYCNDERDFQAMTQFWEMDLTKLQFDVIPDSFFDALIMSHVIEHLPNGDQVLAGLIRKVKRGGVIYVEFPGAWAARLPGMGLGLNFYDEPTHCRVFKVEELRKLAEASGCKVLRGGKRRDWVRLLLTPLIATLRLVRTHVLCGSDFYDLVGYADFVHLRKVT